MADSVITITGNLGDDPELRFTPTGVPVARMSVGVSDRIQDKQSGEWRDGETSWFTVIAWRQMGEHCAETLLRGNRVIVTGPMKSRTWETPEGEKRTSWEITATDIGPSLRFASATIKRTVRNRPTAPDDDMWAGADVTTEPGTTEPAQSATSEAHEPAQTASTGRGRKTRTTAPATA